MVEWIKGRRVGGVNGAIGSVAEREGGRDEQTDGDGKEKKQGKEGGRPLPPFLPRSLSQGGRQASRQAGMDAAREGMREWVDRDGCRVGGEGCVGGEGGGRQGWSKGGMEGLRERAI